MVAFHLERVLASGYSLGELQSGKPVIGIAQTGSDITPCNRHHRELAARVRDGIRTAGGVAFEFPSSDPGNTADSVGRPLDDDTREICESAALNVVYPLRPKSLVRFAM